MKKLCTVLIVCVLLVVSTGSASAFILESLSGMEQTVVERSQMDVPMSCVDVYDLVIIAPEVFSEEVQVLLDHKNAVGMRSFVMTLEEIYDSFDGVDEAEQIKFFIKDAIEEFGVDFVLLVGDHSMVPMRVSAVSWEFFGTMAVPEVLTDLYYADVYDQNGSFSSWDVNGDGVFGEVEMVMGELPYDETLVVVDDVDLVPDVMVGRLPCSKEREVSSMVEKIMTYETSAYGADWSSRLVTMGGDTFPSIGGINEGEVVSEYIVSVLDGFDPIRLWTSEDSFHWWLVNREISRGCGFVSYSGHGFEFGFGTSAPDSSSLISYYLPMILGLRNRDMFPIMYFDACLTGALDAKWMGLDVPCLTLGLLKLQRTGAVACVGATRTGFGGFSGDPFIAGASVMHAGFFESYEPGCYLGEMMLGAQMRYIEDVFGEVMYDPLTVEEFTLFGDPSLKVGGYSNSAE